MIGSQIFLEKASSLQRLPLATPRGSPRKGGMYGPSSSSAPLFSETTIGVAICLVMCVLLLVAYRGQGGPYQNSAATVLGKRSWKDVDLTKSQRLELQIMSKDEEITALKMKISRILASSRMAESNMASQESLIKSLQMRHETEKSAKSKAIFALAEHTKTLDECSRQSQQLENEVEQCRGELSRRLSSL